MKKYIFLSVVIFFSCNSFAKINTKGCDISLEKAYESINGLEIIKYDRVVQFISAVSELSGQITNADLGDTVYLSGVKEFGIIIDDRVKGLVAQLDSLKNSLNEAEAAFHDEGCSFGSYENFKLYFDARNSVFLLLD